MSNKLPDSEIIKEIQGIKESMKRHIDLTNEMGQDLLRIDEEYTGGSKVWLTTDYFKKVVKHFAHSNYLVKCLELILEYINRLQCERNKYRRKVQNQREEINRLQAENERLKTQLYLEKYTDVAKRTIKAEAYKECIEEVKKELSLIRLGCQNLLDNEGVFAIDLARKQVDNLLKELGGEQPILNDVKCIDCEYLELELPYAVCSKAYKGIVAPDDSCGKGKLKELVGEDNDSI